MIELESAKAVDIDVEFDEYVPVTVTWPEASALLASPVYVRCVEEHRLLELKFSPSTMTLVELVLVNSPGLQLQRETFPCDISDTAVNARWAGNETGDQFGHLDVKAFEDYLVLTFSTDPIAAWTGREPVIFGTVASGAVGAICVRWSQVEQDMVFG